jgi:serine/threonine protein kinase
MPGPGPSCPGPSPSADPPLLRKGDTLGGWTIDCLVGQGGGGSVFSLAESPVAGSLGPLVAKCAALPPPAALAKKNAKAARELANIANSLYYEWFLCRTLFTHLPFVCPGPPRPLDYGEAAGCRYFVMKRLDHDLRHLATCCDAAATATTTSTTTKATPHAPASVSLATVCNVGIEILRGLQQLHGMGYLFIDVSPANFMIEKCKHGVRTKASDSVFTPEKDKLYFIDFGLAEKYTEYMLGDAQRPSGTRPAPAGAPLYTSIAVQEHATPARRDDIESLGYLLLALCSRCRLPWAGGGSDEEVLEMKRGTDIRALAASYGCPELGALVAAARGMDYYAEPDYAYLESLLQAMKHRDCAAGTGARAGAGAGAGRSSVAESASTASPMYSFFSSTLGSITSWLSWGGLSWAEMETVTETETYAAHTSTHASSGSDSIPVRDTSLALLQENGNALFPASKNNTTRKHSAKQATKPPRGGSESGVIKAITKTASEGRALTDASEVSTSNSNSKKRARGNDSNKEASENINKNTNNIIECASDFKKKFKKGYKM